MICVGLLIAIRITGTAALRGCMDLDAGLASGTAGLELVGVPGDLDSVSAPAVAVLGVWNSEPVDDWTGSRRRVFRRLEFRRLEFRTRSRSGRSQEKRASLSEQQRSANGNVSGKLIGASDH